MMVKKTTLSKVRSSSNLIGQTEIDRWMKSYGSKFVRNVNRMRKIFSSLSEEVSIKKTEQYKKYFKPFEDTHPIQRWFRCREGFSIELIREILRKNAIRKKVLDPFCGSGTTLVASNELDINSIGFDINPLMTFVSKAKTRRYSKHDREKLEDLIQEILDITDESEKSAVPRLRIINKVFNTEIIDTLLRIKRKISNVKEEKHRNFLKLGWISILESVSNTRKEGNGIKYKFTKRTRSGYISLPQQRWEDEYFGNRKTEYVLEKLRLKYEEMISDLKIDYAFQEPILFTESALELTKFLERDAISMALFSPPYANCFDYFEIFKVELWMGDFVGNYKELKYLRNLALRSNTNVNLNISRGDLDLPELEELVSIMRDEKLWDEKLKKVIIGYFEDMGIALKEIYDILEKSGKCVLIVGNSAYADVLIPTDLLLSKIAKQTGFQNIEIHIARPLTTSSQQRKKLIGLKEYLRESIIFMEK